MRRPLALTFLWTLFIATPALGAPRVVASILPLHSLLAGVMQGVDAPAAIVRGYGSPHTYQMRPSEAAALHEADIVFWIGEELEGFLRKPLATLGARARIVALLRTQGVTLWHNREGGVWEMRHPEHGARDAHGHTHGPGAIDPHLWLDPTNARRIVEHMARELSALDPANGERYRMNAAALTRRLASLEHELGQTLAPVRDRPYLVFHDAFQYLERHYALRAVGAITLSPERLPSAKRLQDLREAIRRLGVRCVFREPQFESAIIASVIEHTGARQAVLDPLGAEFAAGPELYFQMMRANAAAIARCLSSRTDGD